MIQSLQTVSFLHQLSPGAGDSFLASAVTLLGPLPVTQCSSKRSLRLAYLEWAEEQIEAYKESVPRSELLSLADQVVEELRIDREGQYQLTELLLLEAVDRRIFRMLKLPDYRTWCARMRSALAEAADPPRSEPQLPRPAASF